MSPKKSVSQKIGEKTLALRKQLWPKITDDILWHRKRKTGYTTIPRAMSYILQIMDYMSAGQPVSKVYLSLWCHTFDEYMITITNPRIMAFEAGFSGQRAEIAWKARMAILVKLGFIDAKAGSAGPYNHVLILNPYTVIKNLKEKGKEAVPVDLYTALLQRTNEIGADDLFGSTP